MSHNYFNLILSYFRLEQYKTGGGPNNAPPLSDVELKVKNNMAQMSVEGILPVFDSDRGHQVDMIGNNYYIFYVYDL